MNLRTLSDELAALEASIAALTGIAAQLRAALEAAATARDPFAVHAFKPRRSYAHAVSDCRKERAPH